MYKYITRKWDSTRESGFSATYHLLSKDGLSSVCGKAKVGIHGFEIVTRDKPQYAALTCVNCMRSNGK